MPSPLRAGRPQDSRRDAGATKNLMSSPVSTISDIGKHEGQTVTIRGWLYNLRESGKLLFPNFAMAPG